MKVLISGSHGLVGTYLRQGLLARGDEVVRLVRNHAGKHDVAFDLRTRGFDRQAFENFDAFIHLGGVNIGERRLTESRKAAIWDSRLGTTEFLVEIISQLRQPPPTLVVASAVGYYGTRGDEELTESSGPGTGYFAGLCSYWEGAAQEGTKHGVRVANLRSGVVLAKDGGTLERQIPLFKLILGGRLGSGRQYMSWIAIQDEVRAIMHILDTPSLEGPVNLTSPHPVDNGEYTIRLGMALNRPTVFPTPRPLLRLVLGTTLTDELLLTSQRVIPKKLLDSGFRFDYPLLQDAFSAVLAEPEPETTDAVPPVTDEKGTNDENR